MSYIKKYLGNEPHLITSSDIDDFILRKIEENSDLDYKQIEAFDNSDELAKDICGFANLDGGLIFLGISEKREGRNKNLKIFPEKIIWGNISKEKETLENRLFSRIKPRLDFKIYPIRNSSLDGVMFIIEIPNGKEKPYWCKQGFYKRRNFKSELMDYDEIKNMFLNRHLQKQKILDEFIYPLKSHIINVLNYLNEYEQYEYFDIKKFVDSHSSLLFQLDLNLVDFIYDLIRLLKIRYESYKAHSSVSIYLISNNFKSLVEERNGVYERNKQIVKVRAKYVHINTNIQNFIILLDNCLLRKLSPRKYLNNSNDVREILEINYFLPTVPVKNDNTLSEDQFETIWKQIIIDAKNDVVFKNIWNSVDEIHSTCETIIESLDEYI